MTTDAARAEAAPILLSTADLARLLGVTIQTIWNWSRRKEGLPRPILIANRPHYLRADIDAWLKSRPRGRGRRR
jgi:predicted DNA-binding transcriptional regulator AlpA